jgi:hypothetical protein
MYSEKTYQQQYLRDRKKAAKNEGCTKTISSLHNFRTIGYVLQNGQFGTSRQDSAFIAALIAAFLTEPTRLNEEYETRRERVKHAIYFRRLQTASRLP